MTVPLKPGSPRPEPSSWLLVGTTIVASVIQVPRPSVTFTDLLPILVKGSAVNFSGKLSMIQQVCGQDSTAAASDLCLTPSTIKMPFKLEKLQELMSLHACANALGARIRNARLATMARYKETQRLRLLKIPPTFSRYLNTF